MLSKGFHNGNPKIIKKASGRVPQIDPQEAQKRKHTEISTESTFDREISKNKLAQLDDMIVTGKKPLSVSEITHKVAKESELAEKKDKKSKSRSTETSQDQPTDGTSTTTKFIPPSDTGVQHENDDINQVTKKSKTSNDLDSSKRLVVLDHQFDPNARVEDLNFNFASLPISDLTKKAILEDLNFQTMTEVQARSIPVLLSGRDVLGAAKTGSGKTIAFLVPAIELLIRDDFKMRNGTGVLIISPTRELCIQIYDVVQRLCKHQTRITHGVIMGGTSKQTEGAHLGRGIMLLVATPGRLLDHLQNTRSFKYQSLLALVIDEADRILETGFEETLRAIIKLLPTKRQTIFFSATQTKNVQDIARVCINSEPVYIGVNQTEKTATADNIDQGFVIVEPQNRFLLLYSFLKKAKDKKKIIIFMSTCNAVQFYSELLNYIDVKVMDLHGQLSQQRRSKTFIEFINSKTGILVCTDVAARGLDIPAVDWIIQFDPPSNTKEYIHRVGRTARGIGTKGRALIFLYPEELRFLDALKTAKVPLNEFDFPQDKIAQVQPQLEKVLESNVHMYKAAREGYISYINGYTQHPMKQIFDAGMLDLNKVAKSFGLSVAPKVALNISTKQRKNVDKREADLYKMNDGAISKQMEKKLSDAKRQWSK